MTITIINYGLSNLLSVKRGVESLGCNVVITNNPDEVSKAEKIILPGVGAFEDGMKGLEKYNLDSAIIDSAKKGIDILGICLGMQMLFDESDENGIHKGLGLIHGRVEKIPNLDTDNNKQFVPHIGWEKLYPSNGELLFKHKILSDSLINEEMYFVHSYEGKPTNSNHKIASINYGGRDICAIAGYNNVIGCQFHPEKSGKNGIEILANFIK